MNRTMAMAVAALVAIGAGCAAKKNSVVKEEGAMMAPAAKASPARPMPVLAEAKPNPLAEAPAEARQPELAPLVFPVIGFEFDSEVLTAQGRTALDELAASLRARGDRRTLIVEGHADERGPEEYNVVLGQKRANAVRRYLATLGVSDEALRTVSYGENRPADPGRGEDSFAKNRRAEIVPR